MSKSNPTEKKDAVRAVDGNLINQNPDSIDTKYIQDSPKKQHNAFKIVKGKGVIFTQSVKNTLKQEFGCRFSDCYRLFIGPIAKKGEVQSFLDKSGIEVKLIDIFADLEKGQKVDGLQTRLSILDEEIYTLFKEFIVQAHHYDHTRPYHDFEVEPSPYEPDKPKDDLRFRIENCLYDSAVKKES